MILLDTNVISETLRPIPDPAVAAWLTGISLDSVFVSSITIAELLYGLALLPDGKRKKQLAEVIGLFFKDKITNPIQSFDDQDAVAYASISVSRRRAGRPIRELDAQIASIALTRGLIVATRNIDDFAGCGVEIINPWEAE